LPADQWIDHRAQPSEGLVPCLAHRPHRVAGDLVEEACALDEKEVGQTVAAAVDFARRRRAMRRRAHADLLARARARLFHHHDHVLVAVAERDLVPREARRIAETIEHDRRGRDARRRHRPLLDGTPVYVGSRALSRIVARRGAQTIEEGVFDPGSSEATREVDRTARLSQHDRRLDAGDVVEEPAAARLHEHRVPCHLERRARVDHVPRRRAARELRRHDLDRPLRRHHRLDVAIARAPRIAQRAAALGFEDERELVAEPVDGLAQRPSPRLRPFGRPTHATAAVVAPSFDAVGAAPRRILHDLDLVGGRRRRTKRRRIRHRDDPLATQAIDRIGHRHLAEPVMVTEGLPVGREGEQCISIVLAEQAAHAVGEQIAIAKPLAEGEATRPLLVPEDHVDRRAAREPARVDAPDVERLRRDVLPVGSATQRAHPARLVRREHRHRDPLGRERFERRQVDGHLRQPHSLRCAPEAEREGTCAPADLRADVARRAQRQDRMVVRLRPRVPVTRALAALPIRCDEIRDQGGRVLGQPRVERRADVEARPRVVVEDAAQPTARVEEARRRVRRIALAEDARVPIAVGRRRRLGLDDAEPWMLARRLIVVAVDGDGTDASGHDRFVPGHRPSGKPTRS
jgi:hypothetical protein